MKSNIGWFIQQRRKEMGLSQDALAEKASMSERAIRRIENNGEATLTTIYEALNISFQKKMKKHTNLSNGYKIT